MKHFKYLFLFFIFISTDLLAVSYKKWGPVNGSDSSFIYSSASAACSGWRSSNSFTAAEYSGKNPPDFISADGLGVKCMGIANFGSKNAEWRESYYTLREIQIACPSATEKTFKVSVNAPNTICVNNCSFRLQGCVDIPEEKGMTCSAISTGGSCGTATNPGPGSGSPDPGGNPPITSGGANQNNDGSNNASNSANSSSTSTNTSTSTSTSTTENNTTTTNTTTNNTTTTNTSTTVDLSSLENTISNIGKQIVDAVNKINKGDGDPDGEGSSSSPTTGNGNGTDLSGTNSRIDAVKKSIDDLSKWFQEDLPEGESLDVPVSELTKQTFSTGIFSSNAQCPVDRTLNMSVGSRSFSKTISLSPWCDSLAFFGYIILISAYCYGAHIVVSKS